MKKRILPAIVLLLIQGCSGQTGTFGKTPHPPTTEPALPAPDPIRELYDQYKNRNEPSSSLGTVSNGSLKNGRMFPFKGPNFRYFDSTSYLDKHAFVHEKVYQSVLDTYARFEQILPAFEFGLMECSNEHGGKIWPHRTHQNGLSVDFMSPMLKNGKSTTDFNTLGLPHYLMDFDENGV